MSDKLKADVLSAFNGGETTPELAGRVDKEELKFGTRYVSNFLPTHQGGLKKWYGTSKVATVALDASSKHRLIEFDGASEPLALLFSGGDVYSVSAGEVYKQDFNVYEDQISDASYLQINDLIYFANKTSAMFQIQYYGVENGHHIFKLKDSYIKEEPFFPYSWRGNYNKNIQTNGYNGVLTAEATSATFGYALELPQRLQNPGAGINVLFDNGPLNCITGGNKRNDQFVQLDTTCDMTGGMTELKLIRVRGGIESQVGTTQYVGNKQVITENVQLTNYIHGTPVAVNYDKRGILKVVTATQIINAFSFVGATGIEDGYLVFTDIPSGHQNGDKYKIRLEQSSAAADNLSADTGGNVQGYVRYLSSTAYVSDGTESELVQESYTFDSLDIVGRKIRFHVPTNSSVDAWAEGVSVTQNNVYYSDGNYYVAKASGTTGSQQPVHRQGTVSDGKINFEYLHSGYGIATIVSVIDSTHMTIKTEGNLPVLSISAATYNWDTYQWSMWGYHGRYPSKVFTYANRLGCTLDTDGYGSWLQMSKSDEYDDFGTEDYGKQLETSGINTLITGHRDNRINWVLSGYRLYMGSVSGEYNVLGDKSSGSLSPTNVKILPVSNVGGANVDAVKYKDMNLFVGISAQELFRLQYDYSSDDYVPEDLSMVSENLFDEGVTRLHVLRTNDRHLYFLTRNHNLRLASVQEEIKLVGCYRVNVAGDVMDFVISNAGVQSYQFLLVKRGDVFTVEVVNPLYPTYMLSTRSVIRQEGDPVIGGVVTDTELAGKEIFVKNYETGAFYHITVAADGTFENRFSTRALGYGLPMEAEVHTLPPYNQTNKLEGLQQKAVRFTVRLYESGEFSYGASNDFDKWYEYHNWNTQAGQEWNAQHKLMSGDLQLPASFGYMQGNNKADGKYPNTTGVAINLRSHSPEPFNLLMVSNLYV